MINISNEEQQLSAAVNAEEKSGFKITSYKNAVSGAESFSIGMGFMLIKDIEPAVNKDICISTK